MSASVFNLKSFILKLIDEKPEITGYDLKKVVNIQWAASHQQVYRELGFLERDGLLTHVEVFNEGKPNAKKYTITPEGKQVLAQLQVCDERVSLNAYRDPLLIAASVGNENYGIQFVIAAEEEIKANESRINEEGMSELNRNILRRRNALLQVEIDFANRACQF